jgi:hypothetical protein
MSKIGDFVIWCEEKGYYEQNLLTDEWEWITSKTQKEIWDEYFNETR